MGKNPAILYPVFTLAAWTIIVLLLVLRARVASRLKPDHFRYGESQAVQPEVSLPNRNYMNLLELPVLFYVACLMLYVADGRSPLALAVAWAYAGLRIVHSLIHLTYNNVIHRLVAFALSNFVLIGLWICAWSAVTGG